MSKYESQIFLILMGALAVPFIYIALVPFIVFGRVLLGV